MFSSNSYTRGQNSNSDQNSYDLVYKDVIVSYKSYENLLNNNTYTVDTDFQFDKLYKVELIASNLHFTDLNNTSTYLIPDAVKNSTIILSINQLNGNNLEVSHVNVQSFCQIPDNYTPLGGDNGAPPKPSNCISSFINNSPFTAVQFYNPPLSNINKLAISFFDVKGNNLFDPTPSGEYESFIDSFYLTLRFYYFIKRNTATAFSVPVFNYAASGTVDSLFKTPY